MPLSSPQSILVIRHDLCAIVFPEQAPGTELIDKAVIDAALNYIVRNQGRQGQLPIVGRVHNFRLMVCTLHIHHHGVGW